MYIMPIIRYHKMMNQLNHRIGPYRIVEWLIIGVFVYFFLVLERMMLARLAILLVSVVVHELAHGVAAFWCGDTTAKHQGRLSLNPIRHVDPLGSVILPLMLVMSNSPFLFGWAKPVPVQPQYLNDPPNDMVKVAIAGPLSNISLAVCFSTAIKLLVVLFPTVLVGLPWLAQLLGYGVVINIILAVFNMVPIPPMDGSRVLYRFLGPNGQSFLDRIEPYGLLIILVLLFFGVFSFVLQVLAYPIIQLLL